MSTENIIKAAEVSGFNLEFKTKKILDELNLTCHLNSLYKLNDEIIEIDLVAKNHMNRHLIIECKGCESGSFLILIKEQQKQINQLSERVNLDNCVRISQFPSLDNNFITFTGDFYDSKYKRKSKDDTKNNFFKAQEQINSAIFAYYKSLTKQKSDSSIQFIFPLIVTNSQIYVVDFASSITEAKNCKWAFQRIKNTLNFGQPEMMDYLAPVVNINYLEEYLSGCKETQNGGYMPSSSEIIPI